jgi:hypothetical protein
LVAIKDIIEAFLKEDMPDASGKNVEDLLDWLNENFLS